MRSLTISLSSVGLTAAGVPAAEAPALTVTGMMSTAATEPLTDLDMSLSVGAKAISSRSQLDALARGAASASPRRLVLTNGAETQAIPVAPTRDTGPVPFNISGNLTGLPAGLAVYPVLIRVTGSVGGRPSTLIGTATTFLVWAPEQRSPEQKTPVAVILPLADQPRLRSDGKLTDDDLAGEVGPGGRLRRLLDAAAPPVALAVDPTLVQALTVMSRPSGYDYAAAGGRPAHAPKSAEADRFLSDIQNFARNGGRVFALPYGDADLPALVRARKLDTVKYAVNTGVVVLDDLLKRAGGMANAVAYPADGLADPSTVDVLRQLGVRTVILDDRLLPAAPSALYTPAAAVNLAVSGGSTIRALAADHLLTEAASTYTAQGLQRFQAELGMITAELPQQRLQVLALPRDWNPPGDWAGQLLGSITSAYSLPVDLDWGVGVQPDAQRGALTYPAEAQARELPTDYVDSVDDVKTEVLALGPVLCPPESNSTCTQNNIDPMKNALVTATSVAWRGDRRLGGVSLSQQVDGDASAIRNGIQIVASRSVNLTSKHGLVPITLENNTAYKVTVVLAFSSTNRSRLRSAARERLTLDPHQKAQVEIEVDAEGAGTFPLDIRKLNLNGQPLSPDPPNRVLVRSTVYGTIATVITIAAVSVLLLAVVIRFARRLRSRSAPAPALTSTALPPPASAPLSAPSAPSAPVAASPATTPATTSATTPVVRVSGRRPGDGVEHREPHPRPAENRSAGHLVSGAPEPDGTSDPRPAAGSARRRRSGP